MPVGPQCLKNFLIKWNNPFFPPSDLLKGKKNHSYFVEMIHHNLISHIKFRFDKNFGYAERSSFIPFSSCWRRYSAFVLWAEPPFPVFISYATANPTTASDCLHRWTHCSRIYFSYLLSLGERRPFKGVSGRKFNDTCIFWTCVQKIFNGR